MPALRIEGYVIVSADGMLANARNVMPDELKFEGDKAFFTAALDRADLIVHGRNSYEDQPNSPRRKRIVLTRKVAAIAPDPSNPNAMLWNPAGATFEAACEHAGVAPAPSPSSAAPACSTCSWTATTRSGCRSAPQVRLPGGEPCFPGVPARTPQQILAAHGLKPGEPQMLDPADDVSVTPWRRDARSMMPEHLDVPVGRSRRTRGPRPYPR